MIALAGPHAFPVARPIAFLLYMEVPSKTIVQLVLDIIAGIDREAPPSVDE
jgi:hypothetical protein